MTFNQLKYVLELLDAGSFSAAAQKLGLTQPALSLQVQSLENELDFRIVDRSRKPFELTPEGEVFVEKAREIILLIARSAWAFSATAANLALLGVALLKAHSLSSQVEHQD